MNNKIEDNIKSIYFKYNKDKTYHHVVNVANVAAELSEKFGADKEKSILAALLHDISAIISADEMYRIAVERQILLDPAEEKYHFLLHQRISRIIANEYFSINDEDVLSAIECHTTLKRNANDYDKIVFLADKLAWDQEGVPPYYDELIEAIDVSLNFGCYTFIKYQFDNNKLLMPHRWIKESYEYFKDILRNE